MEMTGQSSILGQHWLLLVKRSEDNFDAHMFEVTILNMYHHRNTQGFVKLETVFQADVCYDVQIQVNLYVTSSNYAYIFPHQTHTW